jgi:hypothetical protein
LSLWSANEQGMSCHVTGTPQEIEAMRSMWDELRLTGDGAALQAGPTQKTEGAA